MNVPGAIEELADELGAATGVGAVVLGGSRAIGEQLTSSDWDIGVYYRGDIDLGPLRKRGEVHPPGRWGRIMNGGSWLDIDGVRVDVLLRDLDMVEHWTNEAQHGRFAIDGLPGYIAGIPTYSLTAEAAVARVLRGRFERPTDFPDALAAAAPVVWRMNRDFSLYHAEMNARRGNTIVALGQMTRAILEEAHARCCAQRQWVLNEKHLVRAARLEHAAEPLRRAVNEQLVTALAELRTLLVQTTRT
jgi:Nucleotidyltransferase domain